MRAPVFAATAICGISDSNLDTHLIWQVTDDCMKYHTEHGNGQIRYV